MRESGQFEHFILRDMNGINAIPDYKKLPEQLPKIVATFYSESFEKDTAISIEHHINGQLLYELSRCVLALKTIDWGRLMIWADTSWKEIENVDINFGYENKGTIPVDQFMRYSPVHREFAYLVYDKLSKMSDVSMTTMGPECLIKFKQELDGFETFTKRLSFFGRYGFKFSI